MQKRIKNILSIVLFSLFISNFSYSMMPGTKILTVNEGHKKVEDLVIGDLVAIYDLRDKGIEEELKRIERIKTKKTKELIVIKTDAGILAYGPDQKIYNRKIFKFIRAKELKVGDILFSPELRNLEIKEIKRERLRKKIDLYYISIEDKCLYLALMDDSNHILLHNEVITLTLLAISWGAGETIVTSIALPTLATVGGVLAGLFIKKKAREHGWDADNFDSDLSFLKKKNPDFRKPGHILFTVDDGIGGSSGGSGGPDKDPKDDDKPKIGDSCLTDPIVEVLDKGSTPGGKSHGRTIEKIRPNSDRSVDFNRLPLKEVCEKKDGVWVGKLPDGRNAISRNISKTDPSTIEVQGPGKKRQKWRYPNEKK